MKVSYTYKGEKCRIAEIGVDTYEIQTKKKWFRVTRAELKAMKDRGELTKTYVKGFFD